jgi:23S rRNA pseudouridine1911/1915/1917 synthase
MKEQITPIYQDKNFLAVDKPAGILVHATANSQEQTLVDWLLKHYPEIKKVGDAPEIRPGIVHRLDKDTSGVILVARNKKYFAYLKNLFQTHQIKKTYLALVWGKVEPKTGIIEKPIRLKSGSVKRTVWQGKMEKEAITEYKVLKYLKYNTSFTIVNKLLYFSLLKVMPKTGRTHQIRVHLASINHPVVGDALYGKKTNPFNLKRLFLHAESLEFNQSNGKRIKIEVGLPDELKTIIT